jgi:hypothetical protein
VLSPTVPLRCGVIGNEVLRFGAGDPRGSVVALIKRFRAGELRPAAFGGLGRARGIEPPPPSVVPP